MKPKLIPLIVVACIAGLAIQGAFALVFFTGTMHLGSGAPPFARPVAAPAFAVGPAAVEFAEVAEVAPAAQPCTPEALQALRGPVVPLRDCTFSGPFTHGNLSVFLIHGPDTLKDQKVLTLQSALERNLAVVHEGRLAIDNAADVPVFIQAGDIVKGGTQDRVLPYDQFIPPQTTGFQLAVFCVEAGRSGPRGLELCTSFQSATEQLPGKQLNLAVRQRRSQAEVWNSVRQLQLALAQNAGGSVQAPLSQTSLQLTLENPRVQLAIQNYLSDLTNVPMGKNNAIGMAVAINGQIQSGDVYASSALFQDLWPKLLKASAVAALAERQAGPAATPPSREALQKFMADAETGQAYQQARGNGNLVLRQETAQALLFDTCDGGRENLVLHRSVLAK
jgi:hypothetical protein